MASRFLSVAALLVAAAACVLANTQSPINIKSSEAVDAELPALSFKHYHSSQSSYYLANTGHGCQITLKNWLYNPKVKGGPLPRTFVLEQVHFHWGASDGVGSEHYFNGNPASMEVHLVHWNSKYASYSEASTKADGLAVIGFFIECADCPLTASRRRRLLCSGGPVIPGLRPPLGDAVSRDPGDFTGLPWGSSALLNTALAFRGARSPAEGPTTPQGVAASSRNQTTPQSVGASSGNQTTPGTKARVSRSGPTPRSGPVSRGVRRTLSIEATRVNRTTRGTVAPKDKLPVRSTKAPTSRSSPKSRGTPASRTVRSTKGQVPRGSPKARSPRSTPASLGVLSTLGSQASLGNLTTPHSQASRGTPASGAAMAYSSTPGAETPSGNRTPRGTEVSSGNLTALSTEAPRDTRAAGSTSASPGLLQGRSGLLDFLVGLGNRGHRAHRGHRKKLGHRDQPGLLGPPPLLPGSTERPGRRRPPWLQLLCSAGEPTWLRVSSLLSQYLPDINARIRSRLFPTGIDNYKNPDFQKLVNVIPKIAAEDSEKVEVNADLLAWVVPYLEASGYYTYDGSLTTSPYSENVLWIVYENPIPIGKSQIAPFRAIENHESELLTTNFRQLQSADGVEVRYVA